MISIGILAWEESNQDRLSQLELMENNILHPDTFDFPVLVKRIEEANYHTVV